MLFNLLLVYFVGCSIVYADHANPIVRTPKGAIKGAVLQTILGKNIYAFRGIRYAKAPVDELRFQPPVPVDDWKDVYDATDNGPMCPQPVLTPISEDCLFLNVYTTKLPHGHKNPKRPVMVHFHAGGFYSMTGSSVWGGPQYFMDQDIVMVTLNYRLGSLGFLSTGDKLAPGNNGLKDQVVALKWVQQNIATFGGDPNCVTIFGYSAGGVSVSTHLVSPMSRGLFHRAIAMSDTIFAQWPIVTNQFDLAQKQARLVGCPDDTSENIVKCLKTKSAKELGDTLFGFFEYRYDPLLLWKPVVEPDFGQERFLPENPITLAQKGEFVNVPIMAGISEKEFEYLSFDVIRNASLLNEMDKDFERIAPIAFVYERGTENSRRISRNLRKFYLGDGPLTNNSREGIGKLYADGLVAYGVNRGVKLLSAKNCESTYYYRFSFQGRYSHFYLPGTQTPYGVVHHDDLIYLFYISPLFPKFNQTDPEYKMVQKLTTLFTNFAYTGNPTPTRTGDLDNAQWIPFTTTNNKYMDIGDKLVMKENLYKDRYDEWDKLFPLPKIGQL